MLKQNPEFHELISSVKTHLLDRPEDLEMFNEEIDRFMNDNMNIFELFNYVKSLVSDSLELTEKVEGIENILENDENPLDSISLFLNEIVKLFPNDEKTISYISHITSLYIEDYITIDVFEDMVNNSISSLDIPSKNSINTMILNIKKLSEKTQEEINNHYNASQKVKQYLTANFMTYKPTKAMQFLVTIGLLIEEPEMIKSILKCLKLYSLNLITNESACTWIQSLSLPLFRHFQTICEEKIPPKELCPAILYEDLLKHITVAQGNWVFGEKMNDILSSLPKVASSNTLQLANNDKLEKAKEMQYNYSKAALEIVDLQLNKLYVTLKSGSHAIRRSSEHIFLQFPDQILYSLFGQSFNVEKNDQFYRVVFSSVKEIGEKKFKLHELLIKQKYSINGLSSIDSRCIYKSEMSKYTVIQKLIFCGQNTQLENKQSLKYAKSTILDFSKRFTGMEEKINQFIYALEEQKPYSCCESSALAMFYFLEIYRLINETEPTYIGYISNITNLVFTSPIPLQVFERNEIANIDLILVSFIKSLQNSPKVAQNPLVIESDFAGSVNFVNNIVSVRVDQNPVLIK